MKIANRTIYFEGFYKKLTCVYCSLEEMARQPTSHPGITRVLLLDHIAGGKEEDALVVSSGYFCKSNPMGYTTTDTDALNAAIAQLSF
jgi:hypothetical protein